MGASGGVLCFWVCGAVSLGMWIWRKSAGGGAEKPENLKNYYSFVFKDLEQPKAVGSGYFSHKMRRFGQRQKERI